jgi:hypothetical protein
MGPPRARDIVVLVRMIINVGRGDSLLCSWIQRVCDHPMWSIVCIVTRCLGSALQACKRGQRYNSRLNAVITAREIDSPIRGS